MASSSAPTSPSERYARFVADTLAKRIPAILRIAEEGQNEQAIKQLRAIGRSIDADGPMVLGLEGWPFAGWEDMPQRVNGKRPREAAFFDFEYWLYYRILQSVRFAETRVDPFRAIKHRDIDKHLSWADGALGTTKSFEDGLRLSLAANAHDLSQLSIPEPKSEIGADLLKLDPGEINRLNIIADNFGQEFAGDLVLAVLAAEHGMEVVVHVKQLPMFVSDTTSDDVTILLDRLRPDTPFGGRLLKTVRQGLVRFASNAIWSAPQFFNRLPAEELGTGHRVLTVIKGDLNYRRALGDISVDIGTPLQKLALLPAAPMLSLRSIKSYCVAGVTEWPTGMSRTEFPVDGTIVAVQKIPSPQTAATQPVAQPQTALPRFRRFLRRGQG